MFNNSIPYSIPLQTATDGFGGGNGAWWLILIVLLFSGWGGYGYGAGGGGVSNNYVLTSDFANIERKIDGVNNGLCSGFYESARLQNGTDMTIMNGFANAELARANGNSQIVSEINGVSRQLADCCCQNRYDALQNSYAVQTAVKDGFCQTNFNNSVNTRDIIDNQNAGTKAILDYLVNKENQQLRDENASLKLFASQERQNSYLINKLQPTPIPAFPASNLYGYYGGTTFA